MPAPSPVLYPGSSTFPGSVSTTPIKVAPYKAGDPVTVWQTERPTVRSQS